VLRVVIDTPVLVAAFLGPERSPAGALLEAHRAGEFEHVTSPRLFAELGGVLQRPALERAAGGGRADAFLERVAAAALFVADPYDLPRATADRHHDLLVAVARAGGAGCIVSAEDDLVRSFARGLAIATPEEYLSGLELAERALAGSP
jgi:putative PIN family toxin of toxin-antitoxin system